MITGLSFCSLRSEADSNRCSSFCRAEPSHSAIGPNNRSYWNGFVNIRKPIAEATFPAREMYFRCMELRKYVPNALTMGNLISGVLVIVGLFIWPYGAAFGKLEGIQVYEQGAFSQELKGSAMLILAIIWICGQVFDLLDGMAARWAQTEGPMGAQLDSMADLVSSGIAPAVVGIACLHAWMPALPVFIKFIPLTMALAAAYRLARFNVELMAREKDLGFSGLPAPAGALWWIGVLLIGAEHQAFDSFGGYGLGGTAVAFVSILLGSTVVPLLMVSRLRSMDFKGWGADPSYDRRRIMWLGTIAAVGIVVAIFGHAWGLGLQAGLLLYVMGGKLIRPTTES